MPLKLPFTRHRRQPAEVDPAGPSIGDRGQASEVQTRGGTLRNRGQTPDVDPAVEVPLETVARPPMAIPWTNPSPTTANPPG